MNDILNCIKSDKTKKIAVYFLLSFLFLLLFGENTSPLTKSYMSADSSIYILMGKAIKDGMVPYVNLFEHKGPAMFTIQYIGQLICEGKTGAFIVQICFLTATLYLVNKIIELAKKDLLPIHKTILLFLIMWHLAGTLEGGNTNEEFALPFLLFVLFKALEWLKTNKLDSFNKYLGFLFGCFFGFIALERLNNAMFICVVCLFVVIVLVNKKSYFNIFENGIACLLGTMVIFGIYILNYYLKNALYDMLYSAYVFEFEYAFKQGGTTYFSELLSLDKMIFTVPAILPILICFMAKKSKTYEMLLSVLTALGSVFTVSLGYNFIHYYVLLTPNYVLAIFLFVDFYDELKNNLKKAKTILLALFVLFFVCEGYYVAYSFGSFLLHTVDYNATYREKGFYEHQTLAALDIRDQIPVEDFDSIWGYEIGSKFYIRTNLYPCYKVFDFIKMYETEDLGGFADEIYKDISQIKPKWIVIPSFEADLSDKMETFIYTNYTLNYSNAFYKLYKAV